MSVQVIGTLKPKNGLNFPVVEAIDVAVEGYLNLADAVTHFATQSAIDAINTALGTKANTSDVNTAVSNLQGQINQIAQTAGTGTADTEIGQARVGADGTTYNNLKARLDAEDADLKSDISDLHDEISGIVSTEYDDADYTQRSTYEHTYNGLFSPSGYSANASFKSYSMRVESDTEIYCKSRNDYYFSICIYPDSTLTNGVRYRFVKNDEDTLPYENTPLQVSKGKYIAFTTSAQTILENFDVVFEDYTIVSQKLDFDIQLDQSQIQQASTEIITEIANDYADVSTEYSDKAFTRSSKYDNTYNGYADVNGITINATYKSYGITIDRDTYIYCESKNSNYFSICVYPSISMRGGTRYRFVKNGEDTLPYSDSPVALTKGQYVVFTVTTGDDYTAIMTDYAVEKTLKEYVLLDEAQINQVLELAGAKPAYIKYDGTASGTIVESLDVFLPTKIGYVRYHIIHGTSVANNYDIWRVEGAYATDTSLNDRFALTTSGEWEMAVKLSGNPDFSGGTTHGDEVMDSITFFVDGNLVDISDFTEPTVFSNFQFVQVSKVYNSSDPSQQIATHTSVHQFEDDELTINQTLLWNLSASTQLSAAYMAMHLPAKTVTDHCYTDMAFIPETCLSKYGDTPNAKYVSVYGDTSGVKTDFWITDYPTGLSGGDTLLMTDNGGGSYNKCYFIIARNTAWLPAGETLWKTSTHYRFTVGK